MQIQTEYQVMYPHLHYDDNISKQKGRAQTSRTMNNSGELFGYGFIEEWDYDLIKQFWATNIKVCDFCRANIVSSKPLRIGPQ